MRIGELSRHTGVPVALLRYYEKRGLLVTERSANGFRTYDPAAVDIVLTIRRLLAAGLTTVQIGRLLPYLIDEEGAGSHHAMTPEIRLMLHDELRRLKTQIASLCRARDVITLRLRSGAESGMPRRAAAGPR